MIICILNLRLWFIACSQFVNMNFGISYVYTDRYFSIIIDERKPGLLLASIRLMHDLFTRSLLPFIAAVIKQTISKKGKRMWLFCSLYRKLVRWLRRFKNVREILNMALINDSMIMFSFEKNTAMIFNGAMVHAVMKVVHIILLIKRRTSQCVGTTSTDLFHDASRRVVRSDT